MTLPEWTAQISEELRTAGFEVKDYQGFPMATVPDGHMEIVRFLKFHTTLPANRTMYAEGTLFTPAGVRP